MIHRHKIVYASNVFQSGDIEDGNIYLAASLLSSRLEANTLTATVKSSDRGLLAFKRNAPLTYYYDDKLIGIFYIQDIERTGPDRYKISATSAVGLLVEGQHYGGIYTGQTAGEIVASICGTVPHIVKSSLRDVKLYGWLPIAAPRDNLSQVLFAIGAALKTDLDGVLRIEGLWDGVSRAVGPERMYLESTVKYDSAVTDVSVTEHQYTEGHEERQLFEGSTQEGDIVTFSEPMHGLTAQGFKILEHDANWAKLSAGNGTLTGKAYVHTTREIVRHIQDADTPVIKSVTDATLVSLVNSPAAADRLANYYQWRETAAFPVVYQGELPGDVVAGYHPFDQEGVRYCLQSADITLSNTLKAELRGTIDFLPMQIEETYYRDDVEVVLEDMEWTVPEGVDSILVVLIGGGWGGWSGREGTDAPTGVAAGNGTGGAGGVGGDGGKIFQFSRNVAPGEKFQIRIGIGGPSGGYLAGFDIPPFDPGTSVWNNGDTTFGEYSSASGASSPDGFLEVITQTVYAGQGKTGESGADGGKGGFGPTTGSIPQKTSGDGGSKTDPISGEIYPGGIGANDNVNPTYGIYAWGGGGGGAAVGGNGTNGGSGYITGSGDYFYNTSGGPGGNGGSAKVPEKETVRGMGGTGGHGGGGGGGAGTGLTSNGGTGGIPGKGGQGSKGGQGADGVVIIYYGVKDKRPAGQLVDKTGRTILDRFGRRIIV